MDIADFVVSVLAVGFVERDAGARFASRAGCSVRAPVTCG
jgi:hypothetical protein